MFGQTRAVITRPLVTGFETSALIHAVAYSLTGDGARRAGSGSIWARCWSSCEPDKARARSAGRGVRGCTLRPADERATKYGDANWPSTGARGALCRARPPAEVSS